jgi:hypothetical protein
VNSGCHQAVSVPDALVTSEVHEQWQFWHGAVLASRKNCNFVSRATTLNI